MNNPTHDSPEEREEKAEVLKQERIDRAEILAAELKRFRWEVRLYAALVILYFLADVI